MMQRVSAAKRFVRELWIPFRRHHIGAVAFSVKLRKAL